MEIIAYGYHTKRNISDIFKALWIVHYEFVPHEANDAVRSRSFMIGSPPSVSQT